MFLEILRDFSRPQWMEIVLALKQSQGMAVGDLSERLGMSYMGVKQHCVKLEKLGYLDTWRHPQEVGRPLKLYRLTPKALPLFPTVADSLVGDLLHSVGVSYGGSAPEKLLHGFFQRRTGEYQKVVGDKDPEGKAVAFAKIRNEEGYLSSYFRDGEGGQRIEERHSLLAGIEEDFPLVGRLEEQMFTSVLGRGVSRSVENSSGLTLITFQLS